MKKLIALILLGLALPVSGCTSMPDMETGRRAARAGDHETAAYHYEKLAQFGIPQAQLERGKQYLAGRGAPKNPGKAIEYFRMADGNHDPRAARYIAQARTTLGALAVNGEAPGVTPAEGVNLLKQTANAGDGKALFELGRAYEKGSGVSPDATQAASYYQRAIQEGYNRAHLNLGRLYEKGIGVEQDLAMAREHYELAEKFDIPAEKDLKRLQIQ